MNRELLKNFTPSTRAALEALAGSPSDAVAFHDRLTIFRAALRIGTEVMEQAVGKGGNTPGNFACMAAIGATTAVECTMGLLKELHPELESRSLSAPPDDAQPTAGPTNRIRPLDLD